MTNQKTYDSYIMKKKAADGALIVDHAEIYDENRNGRLKISKARISKITGGQKHFRKHLLNSKYLTI